MVKNNPILVKTLKMEKKFAEEFVQPEQACIVCEEGYFGQKIGKFTKVSLENIFKVEQNILKGPSSLSLRNVNDVLIIQKRMRKSQLIQGQIT